MNFISPWFLLGLAGVAVPIIIHLLTRYRPKRVDWAAMELLRRALMVRSRQIRLEDLLLLVLRCLAIALLAFALARPTLTPKRAEFFGAKTEAAVVVALDGSYSMAHRPGLHTRFDRAVERTKEVLGTLSPGQPVTLVLMGNRPRILLRNVGYDPARFDKALQGAGALPERLNLENCLEELPALVRELKSTIRECYLVTDAQTVTWEQVSDRARASLREIGDAGRLFFVSLASGGVENLGVSGFELASGAMRKGAIARYLAEIHNYGARPAESVTVNLMLDGTAVDRRVVSVDAGQTIAVPMFAHFERAGAAKLTVKLSDDALDVDNSRNAVARIDETVRVLCVDGQPSSEPFKSETDFLITALIPKAAGKSRDGLEVDRIESQSLLSEQLSNYQIVILANVRFRDLSDEQLTSLTGFVRRGGGLVVFLGDNADPEGTNPRMRQEGMALLPAELVGRVKAADEAAEGWPMSPAEGSHSLARVLKALPGGLLDEVRIREYFRLRVLPGARTVLNVGGASDALLVEKPLGRGRVMLCATTADRDWNNMVTNPVFPMLLHQSVALLTRRAHETPFLVDEPVVLPLAETVTDPMVTFRGGPRGKEYPVQVTERLGRRVAELDEATSPGFYEVSGAEPSAAVPIAVNPSPTESDVRCLDDRGAQAAMKGLPATVMTEGQDIAKIIKESRIGRELWRIFLILSLAVFALEALLARHFSRRVTDEDANVPVARAGDRLRSAEVRAAG